MPTPAHPLPDAQAAADERALAALRSQPMFAGASRRDLRRLLAAAQRDQHGPSTPIYDFAEGSPTKSLFLVVDGLLRVTGPYTRLYKRGDMFGLDETFVAPTAPGQLTAIERSTVLKLDSAEMLKLRECSTPFRQSTAPVIKLLAHGKSQQPLDVISAEVVGFASEVLSPAQLSAAIDRLGREVATRFPDRVLIARPGRGGPPAPVPGVPRLYRADADAAQIAAYKTSPEYRFDYILLDGAQPAVPLDLAVAIRRGLPGARPPPLPGTPDELDVLLVGRSGGGTSLPLDGIDVFVAREDAFHYVRVDLDLAALAGGAPGRPDPTTDESVGRWARALTQRRVGLALGGGGVWAIIFVYVLQQLVEGGVPIDEVTGTSAGAMVGGYFAVKGKAGLDQVLHNCLRGPLFAASSLAVVSSAALSRLFEHDLGGVQIQDLPTGFHPVATGTTLGTGVAFTQGGVAEAMRASASFPALFSPTLVGHDRYVDGSLSAIVPAQVLPSLGAQLTFAGNAFPSGSAFVLPLPPFLATLNSIVNPLSRLNDAQSSLTQLFHAAGILGGYSADVTYNSDCPIRFPQLVAPNWFFANRVLAAAAADDDLKRAITDMVDRWTKLRDRGAPVEVAAGTPEGGVSGAAIAGT